MSWRLEIGERVRGGGGLEGLYGLKGRQNKVERYTGRENIDVQLRCVYSPFRRW